MMEGLRTEIVNADNMLVSPPFDYSLIFCDYIYENQDFAWAEKYWKLLARDSVMIAMTDWHSNHRFRVFMEDELGATFVNEMVWKNEWGNHPKNRFHQCYDSVIIYANSKNWRFHAERVQVPKVTKSAGLNPSGRTTKTATAWIDDITLTTVSKERVKKDDGHLIPWQKPLKLYDRVVMPFTDEGDRVLDPFMGSGSLGKWCREYDRHYFGIEIDLAVYELAKKNIFGA